MRRRRHTNVVLNVHFAEPERVNRKPGRTLDEQAKLNDVEYELPVRQGVVGEHNVERGPEHMFAAGSAGHCDVAW